MLIHLAFFGRAISAMPGKHARRALLIAGRPLLTRRLCREIGRRAALESPNEAAPGDAPDRPGDFFPIVRPTRSLSIYDLGRTSLALLLNSVIGARPTEAGSPLYHCCRGFASRPSPAAVSCFYSAIAASRLLGEIKVRAGLFVFFNPASAARVIIPPPFLVIESSH